MTVSLFCLLVLYRLTLMHESLYWGDVFLYFYPLEQFVQSQLREGRLPLWNPYVLCGQPLVGNPQAWVFYPTTALLALLPVWLYLTVNTILHLALAGMGTYLYLRRLGGDRLGAISGAMVYCGSGFLIARIQFPPMLQSMAYLPLLLLLVDRMIDRPGWGYTALMALIVALELLAAHTQIAYMTFACAALYALARLWHIRRHRARARRAVGEMALALLAGVLAASIQLLPALQLFPLSTRGHLTWMQANRYVLLPEQLLNYLFPRFFGSPAQGNYWGSGNAWEPCVYVGLVPLALAVVAVRWGSHRAALRFYTVLGLFALWLAMGRFGGLYALAYYVVPGLASFHDPARFAFLTTFALAALTAVGLRVMRDRQAHNRVRVGLIALSAVNLWWFSAHFTPTLKPVVYGYRPRALAVVPPEGQGRVFTALREQVWSRYLDEADYGPDSARYAHEVTDTLSPNIGMRFGVEEASGYEPVPIRAVTQVDGLVRAAMEQQSPHLPALLGLFNTHLLLLPQSTRYVHPGLSPVRARGVKALAVRNPLPRAWLVRQTIRVEGAERELAALADPDFDPRRIAIVSGGQGLGDVSDLSDAPEVLPVVLRQRQIAELALEADAGSAPAYLVWSAAWYPGWTATVDGRSVPVMRTNRAFQGTVIPPGRHRVVFAYQPFIVRFALYLSLLGSALIAMGLGYGAVTRARPCRNPGAQRGIGARAVK